MLKVKVIRRREQQALLLPHTAITHTLKLAETEPSAYMAACMASAVVKCVVEPFFTRYLPGDGG